MDGHQRVVLQERVRSETRRDIVRGDERIGRADHQPEEEGGHHIHDQGGPPDHQVSAQTPVTPHEDGREDGQDEAPQQNRTGQRRPQPGDGVEQRRHPAVVLGHEDQAEVVCDQGMLHGQDGQHGTEEHDGRKNPAVTHPHGGAAPQVLTGQLRLSRGSGAGAAIPQQSDGDDHRPDHAGGKGQPHADDSERRVHRQQAVPVFAFTRPGYLAV